MSDGTPLPRILVATLLLAMSAGVIAAVVRLGSVLSGDDSLMMAAPVLAMVLIAALPWRLLRVALTGGAALTRGTALRVTLLSVWFASAIVGCTLYGTYRWLRPGYLEMRYDRYVAATAAAPRSPSGAIAELEARRAWLLDPLMQALDGGLWLALTGTFVALFLVYGRPRRQRA